MDITAEMVKELRERTGIGMMECKRALEEAGGDQEKAIEILRKKGYARAADKADRATRDDTFSRRARGAHPHRR